MNILLISANREKIPSPVAPIGLAYVATPLLEDGHDVEILDLCFVDAIDSTLKKTLQRFSPDIIGLSIRNIDNLTYPKSIFYLPEIKKIVDLLKILTDAPLVVGGSGFSLFPEETLRYLGMELGIVGDGEAAFRTLVKNLENKGEIDDTPNLSYLRGDIFTQNPVGMTDSFSRPDRALLDNERYLNLGGMVNLQTKRGCPFKCIYCTYPFLNGTRIRPRDPEDIVDELEELIKKYRCDYAFFVDDIFNHPLKHAYGLCEEIIRREIDIKWTCFATPIGMTQGLTRLMQEAGCIGIEFGTDAASPSSLINLGKSFDLETIETATLYCKNVGLGAAHYLILGGPGETLESLSETLRFMEKLRPKAVIAMPGVRIYPNTKLQEISLQEGVINETDSLLEPRFYFSPKIGEEELISRVGEHANAQNNWVVPGLDIRSSTELFSLLRMFGNKGPLWNMLGEKVSRYAS